MSEDMKSPELTIPNELIMRIFRRDHPLVYENVLLKAHNAVLMEQVAKPPFLVQFNGEDSRKDPQDEEGHGLVDQDTGHDQA